MGLHLYLVKYIIYTIYHVIKCSQHDHSFDKTLFIDKHFVYFTKVFTDEKSQVQFKIS